MNSVKITSNSEGYVIHTSKNPNYGYVIVAQESLVIKDSFMTKRRLTALIHGTITLLESRDFQEGEELPGKIVIKEQTIPFKGIELTNQIKIAGDTAVVCKLDDSVIFRRTVFTSDLDDKDVLVQHDNIEEILEARKSPIYNVADIADETFELVEDIEL